ncbi:uncharacterized protein TNCV_4929101 [Trichonephila clavipes]|nr:uncharacterized protein TNCV_4929101 [Trichonephila clavipes]
MDCNMHKRQAKRFGIHHPRRNNVSIGFHCGRPGHVTRCCRDRRRGFSAARQRRQLDQYERWDSDSVSDYGRDPESNYQRYRRGKVAINENSPVYTAAKLVKNFVSVAFNGHVVNALVDSGDDYLVVSEKLRMQLKTPMFSAHNPILRSACGKVVKAIGRCMLRISGSLITLSDNV